MRNFENFKRSLIWFAIAAAAAACAAMLRYIFAPEILGAAVLMSMFCWPAMALFLLTFEFTKRLPLAFGVYLLGLVPPFVMFAYGLTSPESEPYAWVFGEMYLAGSIGAAVAPLCCIKPWKRS